MKNAIDSICSHWKNTKERKIYMFAMGTDFKKLKYPNHWYDIIHVVKVLSKFEYARQQEAYDEMLAVILNTGSRYLKLFYSACLLCYNMKETSVIFR